MTQLSHQYHSPILPSMSYWFIADDSCQIEYRFQAYNTCERINVLTSKLEESVLEWKEIKEVFFLKKRDTTFR